MDVEPFQFETDFELTRIPKERSMATKVDLSSLVRNWQNSQGTHHANWSGTFAEYLDLVKENPKITRNAFQRMYDMVVEAGTEEYIDFKKPVIRYKFFDDAKTTEKTLSSVSTFH